MTELFTRGFISSVLKELERHLASETDVLDENRMLSTSAEDLCDYFVEKYTLDPPRIDEAGIQADYGDANIDVSGRFEYVVTDRSKPAYVTGTRLTFYIPFEGDSNLLGFRPSTFRQILFQTEVSGNELVIAYERTASDVDRVQTEFRRDLASLKENLD